MYVQFYPSRSRSLKDLRQMSAGFNPKQELSFREVNDSLIIGEIKDYKKVEQNKNGDSTLVVVYVLPDSKFGISSILSLSSIYYTPFTYFTIVENKPVLFYDYKEDSVDPLKLLPSFINYLDGYLMSDIGKHNSETRTVKRYVDFNYSIS